MTNKTPILLASFFDSHNLGDLLIANEIYRRLNSHGSVTRVAYGGRRFTILEELEASPTTSDAATVIPSALRSTVLHIADVLRLRSAIGKARRRREPEHTQLVEEVARSKLLVIGGGNLLYDLRSDTRSALELSYFADLASHAHVPFVVLSAGIGPFQTKSQVQHAVNELNRAHAVSFRDEGSLEVFRKFGGSAPATLSLDPIVAFPRVLTHVDGSGAVALNLVSPELVGARIPFESYVAMVRRVLLDSDTPVVRLFSTDMRDFAFLQELARAVDDDRCSVRTISSLSSLFELFGSSSVVVASRMHSLILAFTQRVPFVAIGWQRKVAEFMRMIGDAESLIELSSIGSNQYVLNSQIRNKRLRAHNLVAAMGATQMELLPRLAVNDTIVKTALLANPSANARPGF